MHQNRREFISTIMAGMAIPAIGSIERIQPHTAENKFRIHLFSKPLDKYDFDFTCECCTGAGIEGLDLTVRNEGKVEPDRVEKDLPVLISKASKHGLATDMIVTGILSADDSAKRILKTASDNGVKYYRLGWYSYDNGDVWKTLQKCKAAVAELVALNQKYKISGSYQNHSGEFIGSPLWDLHELFQGLPSEYLGCQFDARHAMVEGYDTWLLNMRLIAGYINTLSIKDFTWRNVNGRSEPDYVTMGEGIVDWDLYFKALGDLNISAPITLHIEYPLLEPGDEKLPLAKQQEIIVAKLKKDTDFIKSMLTRYQLN
jgi:L-ribulose-5-phosphate 3-epimerase